MSTNESTIGVERQRWPAKPPPIPDYELIRPLGKGGFGEVWMARSVTGVYRAIKLLPGSRVTELEFDGIRAFERHARGHRDIIDVRHVGRSGDWFYYVMELADGLSTSPTFDVSAYEPRTLEAELERRHRLPLHEAISIAQSILSALEHLHRHGLVHRDVKPANVLFVEGRPKLADLGLITSAVEPGVGADTPAYAPPEGPRDPSGDLYSLGVMLYVMVTGQHPDLFPELPSDIDPVSDDFMRRLAPILDRACAPDPKERYATAADFSSALSTATREIQNEMRSGQVAPSGPSTGMRLNATRRLKLPAFVMGSVIIVFAAILIPVLALRKAPRPSAPSDARIGFEPHMRVYHQDGEGKSAVLLNEHSLPLPTKAIVQFKVRLPSSNRAAVVWVDGQGSIKGTKLFGAEGDEETWPLGEGQGWPLNGNAGTEVFILLGGPKGRFDEEEIRRDLKELVHTSGHAFVTDDSMFHLWGGQPAREIWAPGKRGPDVVSAAKLPDPGFLNQLHATFGSSFSIIEAIAATRKRPDHPDGGDAANPKRSSEATDSREE